MKVWLMDPHCVGCEVSHWSSLALPVILRTGEKSLDDTTDAMARDARNAKTAAKRDCDFGWTA